MTISVRILQLGRAVIDLEVESDTSLRAALAAAAVPVDRMDIRVRGRPCSLDDKLRERDTVVVMPRIRGGGAS